MTRKERICLDFVRERTVHDGSRADASPTMKALIKRGLIAVVEGPPRVLRVNEANVRREAEEV